MGLSMADALAKLGAVDHVAVGLARLRQAGGLPGTPGAALAFGAGVLQRVRRLPRARDPAASTRCRPGWSGTGPPTWTPGHHARRLPRRQRDVLAATGPEVVAIVDWEMCTIGDPLLDLGWLLATWRQPDGVSVFGHALAGRTGWPAPTSSSAATPRNTTRDLSHIDLVHRAGLLQARHRARGHAMPGPAPARPPKEVGDLLHAATVHLFERALGLISDKGSAVTQTVTEPPRRGPFQPFQPRP